MTKINQRNLRIEALVNELLEKGKEAALNFLIEKISTKSTGEEILTVRRLLTKDGENNPGLFDPAEITEFWEDYSLVSPRILSKLTEEDSKSGAFAPIYDKYNKRTKALKEALEAIIEDFNQNITNFESTKALFKGINSRIAIHGKSQVVDKKDPVKSPGLPGNKETRKEVQKNYRELKDIREAFENQLNRQFRKETEAAYGGEGTED